MNQNKIFVSLWFSFDRGEMKGIIDYYKNIFGENFEAENIVNLGETLSGKSEMCLVKLFGQKCSFLNTAEKHHDFNDSFSFTINCEDQNEIDKYWDYFTKDGQEYNCGWCIDKFGFRWQIIPENLDKLLSKPNGWQIMMDQKKIIIAEYLD